MQWMRRTDLSVACSGLLRRVVRNLSIQLREHLPCSPNKIYLCANVYSLNHILFWLEPHCYSMPLSGPNWRIDAHAKEKVQ